MENDNSSIYVENDNSNIYAQPFVGEDGIYVPVTYYNYGTQTVYERLISKEIFQEAYEKFIIKGMN